MEVTRKAEYALSALVELATAPPGEYVASRVVAERQGIPPKLIPQLMATLARYGLVEGQRGLGGGVRLAVKPEEIKMARVIELIQGPVAVKRCLVAEGVCTRMEGCPLRQVWARAQEAMLSVLGSTTIADLVEARRALAERQGDGKAQVGRAGAP